MCTQKIQGGFSTKACILWSSFLNANTSYFEWGSGFTTKFSDGKVHSGVSIEGSKSWFDYMQLEPLHTIRLKYVNIGDTKAMSWPLNTSNGGEYINSIDGIKNINVVFIS